MFSKTNNFQKNLPIFGVCENVKKAQKQTMIERCKMKLKMRWVVTVKRYAHSYWCGRDHHSNEILAKQNRNPTLRRYTRTNN